MTYAAFVSWTLPLILPKRRPFSGSASWPAVTQHQLPVEFDVVDPARLESVSVLRAPFSAVHSTIRYRLWRQLPRTGSTSGVAVDCFDLLELSFAH